jgi:endonuclease/exonuclease/phosphatase family metal-dependent hydrolase
MSKHAAEGRRRRERVGVLAATAGVVGVFGLAIALVAGLRAADVGNADPVTSDAANVAAHARPAPGEDPSSPASETSSSPAVEPQRVVPAQPLKLDPIQVVRERAEKRAAKQARREAALPKTSAFRVGTLNVLGSQHTAGKGGFGPGPERAGISAGLIRSRGIDVVGFQEVQDDQIAALQNGLSDFAMWPVQALGNNGQRLQVMWRDSKFELMDTGSVSYVFASQSIPLPWVRLRDREHGGEFYVVTAHNSAGGLESQRDAATTVEIALIKELHATGLPVIITGDMNEHEEFFCRAATEAQMVAANGGSGAGGCQLPPMPRRVDWIMGTDDIDFSGYVQDGASRTAASDHYLLYADVGLDNASTPR